MSKLTVDIAQCRNTGLIKLTARFGSAWARCPHWTLPLPAEKPVEWPDLCDDHEYADENGFDRFSRFGTHSRGITG